MINPEQRQLVHKYLLIELAVKSLQIDYLKVEQFKMNKVFAPIMDSLLKDLRHEYFELKKQLGQQRIRLVGWTTIDEYFSDVQIATSGDDVVLRYANQALKTKVEQLIINHIDGKMKMKS
ncbi:aconitate hydratase [Lysinibacillus sphaericus]|uniref:aconitate hydratase n=1 Tax=Lysinibacillus sphaericus TaxID=1421 RepID=UPI0018CD0D7E|nr:aconitate hydratase [Lysinibacillus sphaericus]MBG9727980.1 aconitate hydratase [Lysinibacillus sphaericus]